MNLINLNGECAKVSNSHTPEFFKTQNEIRTPHSGRDEPVIAASLGLDMASKPAKKRPVPQHYFALQHDIALRSFEKP